MKQTSCAINLAAATNNLWGGGGGSNKYQLHDWHKVCLFNITCTIKRYLPFGVLIKVL
jgi:hypothetical protein